MVVIKGMARMKKGLRLLKSAERDLNRALAVAMVPTLLHMNLVSLTTSIAPCVVDVKTVTDAHDLGVNARRRLMNAERMKKRAEQRLALDNGGQYQLLALADGAVDDHVANGGG